jgi:hypothetical protein
MAFNVFSLGLSVDGNMDRVFQPDETPHFDCCH